MAADKPTNAWVPEAEAEAPDATGQTVPVTPTDTTEEDPVAAAKGTKVPSQTEAPSDGADVQEGAQPVPPSSSSPEQDAQPSQGSDPKVYSETSDESEGSDGEQAPSGPEVVNDGTGQHVDFPDGSTVYTRSHSFPVSNAEWEAYEVTHSGDQSRYPYTPGDKEYDPYSDPHVPNSHLARMVETQIVSYAERVKNDPDAVISPTWSSLRPDYDASLRNAIDGGMESGKVRA